MVELWVKTIAGAGTGGSAVGDTSGWRRKKRRRRRWVILVN